MTRCATCGNDYDKAFHVILHDGSEFDFDSVECAVKHIAPTCAHCGCAILGHGAEAKGRMYCCAHCAKQHGERGLDDRVD